MAGITYPRPLSEKDERDEFDCGREALNLWFRRHAWRNHDTGMSRVSVICDRETDRIVGYVSLSTAQIERQFLPKSAQRNRPDPIPVILLGQLAIDRYHQGKGYARSLMLYALKTALNASKGIGCFGVITHPLDEEVRDFYASFGFEELPFDPKRAMIVRMIDLDRNGFG